MHTRKNVLLYLALVFAEWFPVTQLGDAFGPTFVEVRFLFSRLRTIKGCLPWCAEETSQGWTRGWQYLSFLFVRFFACFSTLQMQVKKEPLHGNQFKQSEGQEWLRRGTFDMYWHQYTHGLTHFIWQVGPGPHICFYSCSAVLLNMNTSFLSHRHFVHTWTLLPFFFFAISVIHGYRRSKSGRENANAIQLQLKWNRRFAYV